MSIEQLDHTPALDNKISGEIMVTPEIEGLRLNPAIDSTELFSARKMNSSEYPEGPNVKLNLDTPIESAVSSRSDVEQYLMAVISLGEKVALGVVKGKDSNGKEISYVSLINNDPNDNDGRARFVGILDGNTPLRIGRQKIEQLIGREGCAPGVSGEHCTLDLKNGVLSVQDESSLNGTTVFTNATKNTTVGLPDIRMWSQPSNETKKLISAETDQVAEIIPTSKEDNRTPDSEETSKDNEVRFTDAEILGKSFRVKRAVQETGTQSIKTWQGLKAKVRNAIDTPGKVVKQFAYNRAKNAHQRREARLQAATNERLRQKRLIPAERAKSKLAMRENNLKEHVGRMNERVSTVNENANRRRAEYIDELKSRKEDALARKTVRAQLRQDGATRRETRSIMSEIPRTHLDRIGKLAVLVETSGRLSEPRESNDLRSSIGEEHNLEQLLRQVLNETQESEDQE